MRVLPITNTNSPSKNETTFKARISKNFVKQMLGKKEPLKDLVYTSTKGILYTLPALAVAGLYSKNSDDEEKVEKEIENSNIRVSSLLTLKELKALDEDDFLQVAGTQDVNGNTIFHKEKDVEDLLFILSVKNPNIGKKVFTLKNNDGKTAYQANPSAELKNTIEDIATDGGLSLEESLELLESNFNSKEYFSNVFEFLKARKNRERANSEINDLLMIELQKPEKKRMVDVAIAGYGEYPEVPIDVAARVFVPDEDNTFAKLDKDYLLKEASGFDVAAIVISASKSDNKDLLGDIILGTNNAFQEKVAKNTSLLLTNTKGLQNLISYLNNDSISKFFKHKDSTKNENIMHRFAYPEKINSFNELLDLMENEMDVEDIDDVLLQKNINGYLPAAMSDEPALSTINFYQRMSQLDSLKKIFTTSNNHRATILHEISDMNVAKKLFEAMSSEPEMLSEILTVKDYCNATAYQNLSVKRKDEAIFIKDKIIELATDSDLSIEKSIELLEANDLEPQIVEYLKMKQESEILHQLVKKCGY